MLQKRREEEGQRGPQRGGAPGASGRGTPPPGATLFWDQWGPQVRRAGVAGSRCPGLALMASGSKWVRGVRAGADVYMTPALARE